MQAWQVHENGEPSEVMRLADVEQPTPGDGQVLLKVRAANINFPDVLMCRGHYQVRPPLPFTPQGGDIRALINEHRSYFPMNEHMVTMDPRTTPRPGRYWPSC